VSVAFQIEVRRSNRATALTLITGAIPVVGLLMSAASLLAGPSFLIQGSEPVSGLLAAVAIIVAVALCRVTIRPLFMRSSEAQAIRLSVDHAGSILCSDSPGCAATPLSMRTVCRLPGLIVMALAPSPEDRVSKRRGITLWLGRDGMPAESWRVLNVWLLWQLRGQTLQQSPGNPST
jgi:hypothetical protein